ncbi:MAG: glycosyltransferase family 2 protein [Chlamydiae bacterium]|nr:glycosyltransferase family 2 protein [Chlamydiota bacterium]
MELSIITVTYRSEKYIDSCILSVITHLMTESYEHIIVDNGSDDKTVELIESSYLKYVRLIKNSSNLGFSAANNLALSQAQGRYILFLNPDMQMYRGYLDDLIIWADTVPDLGIATCQLLDDSFRPHPLLRPCKFPLLRHYIVWCLSSKPFIRSVTEPYLFYPGFDDDKIQEVEQVRGAFMLIRKEVLDRLGYGFDPRYFIVFEDMDLCKQMDSDGYKVMYNPSVGCIDFCNRSFVERSATWKYCHMAQSLKTYVRKWHSVWHLIWMNILIPIGFLFRMKKWGVRNSLQSLSRFIVSKE